MANWHALFPQHAADALEGLKAAIAADCRSADAAFDDQASRMTLAEAAHPTATLVGFGNLQSFGGRAGGMPFMGDDWHEARRRNPAPLAIDAASVVTDDGHYFRDDFVWMLRGHVAYREIARARLPYARVRARLEALASPFGENAVRLALLDLFPHALAVGVQLGAGDRTLLRVTSPDRGVLTMDTRVVRPEQVIDEAFREAVAVPHACKRSYALRFARDMPLVSFVKHAEPEDASVFDGIGDDGVIRVPDACLYDAANRDGEALRRHLRACGYAVTDAFAVDADELHAWILTV